LIDCNEYSDIQGNGMGANHDRSTDSFDSTSMELDSSARELDETIRRIGTRHQITEGRGKTIGREGSV